MPKTPSLPLFIAGVVAGIFSLGLYVQSELGGPGENYAVWGNCMGTGVGFPKKAMHNVVPIRGLDEVAAGDVLVVKAEGKKATWAMRVIGLPGQTVRLEGTDVWVNGTQLARAPWPHNPWAFVEADDYKVIYDKSYPLPNRSFTVGDEQLFMLTDTRQSGDCFDIGGLVDSDRIAGRY
jgi:signal peptidase I